MRIEIQSKDNTDSKNVVFYAKNIAYIDKNSMHERYTPGFS